MPLHRLIYGILLGLACASPAAANDMPFERWLADFKQEAHQQGINENLLDDAFAETSPLPRVIELDRKQPESTLTMEEYLEKVVSDLRIQNGREKIEQHRALLEKISRQYDVPAAIIVALWGIETNYGDNMGNFDIVDALATLAYDGRRSEFFRRELLNALRIMQAEKMTTADMQGSWAGAMGQCQFMPSSYLKYAVDQDGDGKRDIWTNEADVFASIANYLHSEGWSNDKDADFNVLLKWNRSRYFATAVMRIAEEIGG